MVNEPFLYSDIVSDIISKFHEFIEKVRKEIRDEKENFAGAGGVASDFQ